MDTMTQLNKWNKLRIRTTKTKRRKKHCHKAPIDDYIDCMANHSWTVVAGVEVEECTLDEHREQVEGRISDPTFSYEDEGERDKERKEQLHKLVVKEVLVEDRMIPSMEKIPNICSRQERIGNIVEAVEEVQAEIVEEVGILLLGQEDDN